MRTDKHGVANSRFSKLYERAYNVGINSIILQWILGLQREHVNWIHMATRYVPVAGPCEYGNKSLISI